MKGHPTAAPSWFGLLFWLSAFSISSAVACLTAVGRMPLWLVATVMFAVTFLAVASAFMRVENHCWPEASPAQPPKFRGCPFTQGE